MCKIKIKVNCVHCHSPKVVKNGIKKTGRQNFLCKDCGKQFQHEYFYQGANPSVKEGVKRSLLHGSGIRDCYKVWGVSLSTVLRLIEQEGKDLKIKPRQKYYNKIQIDEMYSFVGNKSKKVWIFYAYAPETKEILAITMGKRTTKQLRSLMLQIKHLRITIDFYCTDGFSGFEALFPWEQHLVGKAFTKAIEGFNTNIRAKIARMNRRTTKFSKKLKYQWYLFKIFIYYINELPSYI